MQKNFVVKKKEHGYQELTDALSDTDIEARRTMEGGDAMVRFSSLRKPKNENLAIGDGFLIAPKPKEVPKPQKSTTQRAFAELMKVKDEMKIDLRKPLSTESSKDSLPYKLYPIPEVSERSTSSVHLKQDNSDEKIKKILEENRARAQNRPMSASRRIKMDKDFEIRKAYFTSEESVMNSAFNEEKAAEVAKVMSASQNNRSETTESETVSSYKLAQIQRLSRDSYQRYHSRLLRYEVNGSIDRGSSTYDESLLSFRTVSTTSCNGCICLGRKSRKSKKD